ncbi:Gigaxonin, partial [Ophiophagus hannah]
DANLVLDGQEIPVQTNILAAASPYVRTKLNYNSPKDDGSVYKIELEGISVDTMKEILDYIFSGQIKLSEDTIQDVVQAADLLLLTDLKKLCCEFLEGCIAAENCIGIRDFALHYCLLHVHYLASEYLETHFRDVSSTEEFLELTPQRLKEVLSLEKLNVGDEKHIFEAVIRWISHDPELRKVHMKDVMSAVWVTGLDSTYLREQMMNEPLVREIVKECNNIPLTPPQQEEAMLASFKPRGYSECIVTVGGEERVSRKPSAAVRCMCPLYDRHRQLWIELAPMSTPRINHSVLSAEGFLFVLGGQDENKTTLNSGEKYDPDTNTWSPLPPMTEARHNFGLVEIDGVLYVLGGEDGEQVLTSMESYDIYNRTWTKQPDLTMIRKIGCYAAMKKKIYAMGGGSYGKLFESVECYDPRTQQFGAVACGVASELYVFGGVRSRDDNQTSEMVTCKSEFYHDEFKRWIYLSDQNLCIPASSSFVYGAVPIGASIYVIGDLDTEQIFLPVDDGFLAFFIRYQLRLRSGIPKKHRDVAPDETPLPILPPPHRMRRFAHRQLQTLPPPTAAGAAPLPPRPRPFSLTVPSRSSRDEEHPGKAHCTDIRFLLTEKPSVPQADILNRILGFGAAKPIKVQGYYNIEVCCKTLQMTAAYALLVCLNSESKIALDNNTTWAVLSLCYNRALLGNE